MKRRAFLKGSGYLGLLAFLQACQLTNLIRDAQIPTSTPTDTPTRFPTFTTTPTRTPFSPATNSPVPPTTLPSDTPGPTPGLTPEATPAEIAAGTPNSPVASPTSTPTATSTPTPTPTPYPPGPPSKLGLFLTKFDPKVLELVAQGQPSIIKTLEIDGGFVQGLKDSSPNTLIIGRITLGHMDLESDPLALAHAFVDKLLPLATESKRAAAFDGWEAYNEPIAHTPDHMKRLADFEAERTRILAENGIRSVVGNFSVGNPPLELWPHFKPALDAINQYNGYLGLHEYSAPTMQFMAGDNQPEGAASEGDEGWLTLRYRKVYRTQLIPMGYGHIPTLITECGVDGLVQPRPGPAEARGWQDFRDTWLSSGMRDDPPGLYMDQLIWYDQNLQQDDYIKGAALFLAGSNTQDWNSYDILGLGAGRMADLLGQYLEVHPLR